jgi:hypothetical protein
MKKPSVISDHSEGHKATEFNLLIPSFLLFYSMQEKQRWGVGGVLGGHTDRTVQGKPPKNSSFPHSQIRNQAKGTSILKCRQLWRITFVYPVNHLSITCPFAGIQCPSS